MMSVDAHLMEMLYSSIKQLGTHLLVMGIEGTSGLRVDGLTDGFPDERG